MRRPRGTHGDDGSRLLYGNRSSHAASPSHRADRRRVGRPPADDGGRVRDPSERRQCVRCRRRRDCSWAASSNRISTASAARRSCSSIRSSDKKVTSIVGQGWAPKGATIDWYVAQKKTLDGAGLDPAVVPGALHAALTVLERWGTMSFEQVSARAIEYARKGFPLRPRTAQAIRRQPRSSSRSWPRQPDVLAEARRLDVQAPATRSSCRRWRARCDGWSRPSARPSEGTRGRHRRGARSLLQRRHRRTRWWRSSSSTTRRSS